MPGSNLSARHLSWHMLEKLPLRRFLIGICSEGSLPLDEPVYAYSSGSSKSFETRVHSLLYLNCPERSGSTVSVALIPPI